MHVMAKETKPSKRVFQKCWKAKHRLLPDSSTEGLSEEGE
jgi:hypothetical protein